MTIYRRAPRLMTSAFGRLADELAPETLLADEFEEHPETRYGLATMCVGLGMGGTVIWENPHWKGTTRE